MTRSIVRLFGAASALAALGLPASDAQVPASPAPTVPGVTLRYKFTPGQVHRYKMTMNMTGTMLTGQSGAGIPLNTAMEMVMRQTVKSVRPADGAATLVVQIENMRMAVNGQETPMSGAQSAPLKKPFTQTMLPSGKVLSMTLPEMPGAGLPGMDFSKNMSGLSIAFPEGPVKAGDTWKGTADVPGMAGTAMTLDSTLSALTGDGDAARANISQKLGGTLGMTLSKGMPMGMKMAGTLAGTNALVFNTAAGAVESQISENDIDMTMTFAPKPGEAAPEGMPSGMKMQMHQKTVVERLPDTAAPTVPAK